MKGANLVLTYQETAELLGTDRDTVRGLVKAYKLSPKPVPRSGPAKGLDINDLCILAKALNRPAPSLEDMRSLAAVA